MADDNAPHIVTDAQKKMISLRSPLVRRLLSGVGANALGKLWVVIAQLASVPIFTSAWGASGFGIWLMITTIPTYIALADFGLGIAAGVDMTTAATRKDIEAARRSFQSAWLFLTLTTGAAAAICISVASIWFVYRQESIDGPFTHREIYATIILIVLTSFLTMQTAISKMVFQATHKYALGTIVFDLIQFLGFLASLLAVMVGYGIAVAALLQFLVRLIGLPLYILLHIHLEPWSTIGWQYADRATLRRLAKPSLSALSLTLANSFGLQGVVLTIGWTFGPAVAATFATSRMLTRVPLQVSSLLSRASLPELTRAQIAADHHTTDRLMLLNTLIAVSIMLAASVILFLVGPPLLHRLSHGTMMTSRLDFAIISASSIICAVWTTLGTRLVAINLQSAFAHIALGSYLAVAVTPLVFHSSTLPTLIGIVVADILILVRTFSGLQRVAICERR